MGLNLLEEARDYLATGLCVLPAKRAEKRPAVRSWKQYQKTMPTVAEVSAWFANTQDGLCLICGAVCGNLEMIDFDAGGELFDSWWQRIPTDLRNRLVIETTPSGGKHVVYRCKVGICGNLKLAQRKDGDKIITLIETRGEGGLFLCAPTNGYKIIQGDICDLPVLTAEERDVLLQTAWELNEYLPPVVDGVPGAAVPGAAVPGAPTRGGVAQPSAGGYADRPGDDFNAHGDVRALLVSHGWTLAQSGSNEYWRRPGKTSGWSATLKDRVFYVFSSNAVPFEPNRAYSPFSVYTLLNHGGDFEQAARSLRQLGYGNNPRNGDATENSETSGGGGTSGGGCVDISALVTNLTALCNGHSNSLSEPSCDEVDVRPLKELIDHFAGLNAPVIHGLLREGETMNIIASPKMGKSWFVSRLAIAIASGMDWLGLAVEQGRVLHIDNELHHNTSAYRYDVISKAMGLPHHLYSENIDMASLRGQLRDLYALEDLFNQLDSAQYKLIIIDAFYRTLPKDTDENDNGAITSLYNRIDYYAAQLQCAFVLIHHTSKGNQSAKAVTDVGAGAGSQSRAADTHLILRPHEQEGIIVLESVVRSWPPMPPLTLTWNWPLFTSADDVDPSALLGCVKAKPKPKAMTLEAFVDHCVAINEPCSKRSVCYEANQRFGLSERQANDKLDLALERELAIKIRTGASMRYVKNRPGISGDKALWAAAMLARDPNIDLQKLADTVGVSERYARQIRQMIHDENAELGK